MILLALMLTVLFVAFMLLMIWVIIFACKMIWEEITGR